MIEADDGDTLLNVRGLLFDEQIKLNHAQPPKTPSNKRKRKEIADTGKNLIKNPHLGLGDICKRIKKKVTPHKILTKSAYK